MPGNERGGFNRGDRVKFSVKGLKAFNRRIAKTGIVTTGQGQDGIISVLMDSRASVQRFHHSFFVLEGETP